MESAGDGEIRPFGNNCNPDVLEFLADLSNDGVLTPHQTLDLLPQGLKADYMGPEKQIPDLQERLGRIFAKKIYGIVITGLTGLMPRRSLYCTKDAGNEYNVADFEDQQGKSVSVASSTLGRMANAGTVTPRKKK